MPPHEHLGSSRAGWCGEILQLEKSPEPGVPGVPMGLVEPRGTGAEYAPRSPAPLQSARCFPELSGRSRQILMVVVIKQETA